MPDAGSQKGLPSEDEGGLPLFGQSLIVEATIPFAFNVEGKVLPAGQYEFTPAANLATLIVFDKVGDVFTLSEIWVPGLDGFMLHMTKEAHEHRIVNVSK